MGDIRIIGLENRTVRPNTNDESAADFFFYTNTLRKGMTLFVLFLSLGRGTYKRKPGLLEN